MQLVYSSQPAVRVWAVALILLLASLTMNTGCSESTSDVRVYSVSGVVRVTSHLTDETGNPQGDSTLYDVTGLPVHLFEDGKIEDSTLTENGRYTFRGVPPGTYRVMTWVVPALAESTDYVSLVSTEIATPDTLDLRATAIPAVYPNPMAPWSGGHTRVSFNLAESVEVSMLVHDISRHLVKTLQDGVLPPGRHGITWDGKDEHGVTVPAAPYWVVLSAGGNLGYEVLLVTGPS